MNKVIHKKIVFDENNKPLEVIISYDDWKKVEQTLESYTRSILKADLHRYVGILHLEEDPLEFQREIRSEWG